MKRYALLIGVDNYQADFIPQLGGCERGVDDMKDYLQKTFSSDIDIYTLENFEATRKNVLDAIQGHLGKARKGELAFLFFTGHGALEKSPEQFIPYQQDNRHECIVTFDSFTQDEDKTIYPIADKELNVLMHGLTNNGAETVVVFDCCHAGSGLRDRDHEGIKEILNSNLLNRVRSQSDFIPQTFDLLSLDHKPEYIFLAACNQRERAKEDIVDFTQTTVGLFTYSLLSVLKESNHEISYHDLLYATKYYIKSLDSIHQQTPKLEVSGSFDAGRVFLSDQFSPSRIGTKKISFDTRRNQWKIGIGALHGLILDSKEPAKFQIFQNIESEQKLVCSAKIAEIGIVDSTLSLIPDNSNGQAHFNLDKNESYFALPTYLPIEKLPFYITIDKNVNSATVFDEETGIKLFNELPSQEEIQQMTKEEKEKINVNVNKEVFESSIDLISDRKIGEHQKYQLVVEQDSFFLIYRETGKPVINFADGRINRQDEITLLAEVMLHIAKWEQTLRLGGDPSMILLRNQAAFAHPPEESKLDLRFFVEGKAYDNIRNEITIDFKPGKTGEKDLHEVSVKLAAKNNLSDTVNGKLIYLSRHFHVFELSNSSGPIENNGNYKILDECMFNIPADKEPNLHQTTDTFLVIFSEEELGYLHLGRPRSIVDIVKFYRSRSTRGKLRGGPIYEKGRQWAAHTLTIKTLLELGYVNSENNILIGNQLIIHSHPTFKATVSLSSSADFIHGPYSDKCIKYKVEKHSFQLLDFSKIGNKETIIEIYHMKAKETVTERDPLVIEFQPSLSEQVDLLAITLPPKLMGDLDYDDNEAALWPGDFPVLGCLENNGQNRLQLKINNIPENPDDGRIGPKNSLKISFVIIPKNKTSSVKQAMIKGIDGQTWIAFDQLV